MEVVRTEWERISDEQQRQMLAAQAEADDRDTSAAGAADGPAE